mgnify:CR=1 FL=1
MQITVCKVLIGRGFQTKHELHANQQVSGVEHGVRCTPGSQITIIKIEVQRHRVQAVDIGISICIIRQGIDIGNRVICRVAILVYLVEVIDTVTV